ncbi:MAG: sugar ABC transporter permease, partial [Actinomycetota bacterium]|nr:sugar ABC transporter permease [Actinomycetota bacterium]
MAGTAQTGRGPEKVPWKNREHEGLAAGLFLLPNLIGFLIFTAIPVGAAFVLAFYDYDLLLGASWAGLENFRELFTVDRVFRAALFNTVYFTAVSVPLSVVLGLATAILVNQALRGVVIFRSIFLLPYVTVTVALSLVWKWLYLPDIGLINSVLGAVGIDGPAWLTSQTWAMPALILMSVWKGFGYNMVIFLAGLQGIPDHLYDAAKVDGATAWRRFLNVTLPLLSP